MSLDNKAKITHTMVLLIGMYRFENQNVKKAVKGRLVIHLNYGVGGELDECHGAPNKTNEWVLEQISLNSIDANHAEAKLSGSRRSF